MNDKNKIRILLLDDDPGAWAFLKQRMKEESSPYINKYSEELVKVAVNKNDFDENEFNEINKYSCLFPVLRDYDEALNFFEIKWLSSETFAKNYFHKVNHIEARYGHKTLESIGYIPDVVVIDYDLRSNGSHEQPTAFESELIKMNIDPCYSLDIFLTEQKDVIPKESNRYAITRRAIDEKTGQPTMLNRNGLYCGAFITNKFRFDTPCGGVSSTATSTYDTEGSDAGLVEWFLDDKVENIFIDGVRLSEIKGWKTIINKAIPGYRKSILRLIGLNKIQVDLNEIIKLLDGKFLQDNAGKRECSYFSFVSIYGKRQLPLDGLFIDVDLSDAEESTIPDDMEKVLNGRKVSARDVEIWNFIKKIIDIIVSAANFGKEIKLEDIKRAQEIADTLLTEYFAKFENRYYLSDFAYRKSKGLELSEKEEAEYTAFRTEFQVNEKDQTIADDVGVSILNYLDNTDSTVIRLAIFYLVADAEIRLSKLRAKTPKQIYERLTEDELYCLLNPVISGDLILPIHGDKPISKYAELFVTTLCRKKVVADRKPHEFFNFEWLSSGEKIILRSYFCEDESILPNWLKNKR